ncbi:MAG: hypothetical protein RBS68_06470 [Anaerolineales bacterium]|jgi:hypothetical protein|nr:hypothetical protein [Anaerolineales bacterium]
MSIKFRRLQGLAKGFLIVFTLLATLFFPHLSLAQAETPAAPSQPVKLVFIHHSTGENWLRDGYGDLGQTLAANNYFVSDTNYGWGPNGIGDRTDIPDWPEWFRSQQTQVYVDALYHESGQNAGYTRNFDDPGGENVIVLFKSCFPNSALEGSPNDPPDPQGWLSVGHAKYVYNEILQYFATRPDKLFIVITAPPLSDGTYAANARAFNNWLVNDWLAENGYLLNNVAVFDFYNVLTSPDAHHRYANGQVEHLVPARNTLAYPSDDDHPSEKGSRKATDEFIGMLNFYYQRWTTDNPSALPPAGLPTVESEPIQPAAGVPLPPALLGQIDDFETPSDWQAFTDDASPSSLTCAPVSAKAKSGAASLQLDFDVAPASWATCSLFFDQPQDWSAAESLAFDLLAGATHFNVDLYVGVGDSRATYAYRAESLAVTSETWVAYGIPWEQFQRVAWEENAGAAFNQPDQVSGIAFGFLSDPAENLRGQIWIDNLHLASGVSQPNPDAAPQASPQASEPASRPGGLPCASSLVAPLGLAAAAWAAARPKRSRHSGGGNQRPWASQ